MSTTTLEPDTGQGQPGAATAEVPHTLRRNWRTVLARTLVVPLVLAVVLVALYIYDQHLTTLDSVSRATVNSSQIKTSLEEHIKLTAVAAFFILLISIPLGILLTRRWARFLSAPILGLANIGQSTPAFGLLALLALAWQTGFQTAVVGLVIYSVLPVLRNTIVGIEQVDRSLVDAGRGMGMTASSLLLRVELPLAVPVILAGVRTALVLSVGVATLATLIGGGGLGRLIVTGISLNRPPVLITGGVLTIVLALAFDWLGATAEDLLRPKGL